MRRDTLVPRSDWRERVESQGLTWHTKPDGQPYWDESAFWSFRPDEVDRIEEATADLYDMCLEAVGSVVEGGRLAEFGYDGEVADLITDSWRSLSNQPTFYARFDLAYDGEDLKLLELNGDTPTSLVEASVVQWWWLQDRFPDADQFNSIHEKLQAAMATYAEYEGDRGPLWFTAVTPHAEDEGTVSYIASLADEAGIDARFIGLEDIGWREGADAAFVDLDGAPIRDLFKLVPWEWLLDDPFGRQLAQQAHSGGIRLIEPAWKMVASNKRLLVTLNELYPSHELLLDASTSADIAARWGDHVRKPVRGREGANVTLVRDGRTTSTEGTYDDDLFVYQRAANLARAGGRYAVLGSWVVNREACGMGIRESDGPITGDTASFVPHLID